MLGEIAAKITQNKKMIYPLFFCPSIEGGGVEKNLYLLSNYSAKKFRKIYILTAHKNVKKKFDKRVILITPKSNKWSKSLAV